MTTTDEIKNPENIWNHYKYLRAGEKDMSVAGVLSWKTTPKDNGKRITISIICSDGMYSISQSLLIEIKYPTAAGNTTESNSTEAFNFTNNLAEVETVKAVDFFADQLKAKV